MALLPGLWSVAFVGASAVAALAWKMSQCRHPGPLGLLPPVVDDHGVRQPARWYCDRCGKTIDAAFDRDRTPVPRFVGYDQTKAAGAAKRADELASRQRELAVRRAGMNVTRSKPAKLVEPARKPVPIQGRRLAG
jgi:hypothetical protein